MTFDKSVSKGYDKLRANRLGLLKGMKAVDDTLAKKKIVKQKRKSCYRDKDTREKLKKQKGRLFR